MTQEHSGVNHFLPDSEQAVINPLGAAGAATLGSSIRALREARGWGLVDVSARLKFGVRQIEALESERWEDLPQGPSLRGLVRNYARLLEIAPDSLMQALPDHLQHHTSVAPGSLAAVGALPHSTLPRWSSESRRRRSWPIVLLVIFLILALSLAAYLVFAWWLPRNAQNVSSDATGFPLAVNSGSASVETLAPPQPVAPVNAPALSNPALPSGTAPGAHGMAQAPVAAAGSLASGNSQAASGLAGNVGAPVASGGAAGNPSGMPAATGDALSAPADPAAPVPAVPANQLVFNATAASWVEVRDASGAVALSSTVQPGSTARVEVTPPARVVIGNAKGVSLSWQGNEVDLGPHQRGNVARFTVE